MKTRRPAPVSNEQPAIRPDSRHRFANGDANSEMSSSDTSKPASSNPTSAGLSDRDELAAGPGEGPPPPIAADHFPEDGRGKRRLGSLIALIAGEAFVIVGIGALIVRIIFVKLGILYGASAVTHVDAAVGASIAIGAAFTVWGWSSMRRAAAVKSKRPSSPGWTDWFSGVTALVSAGALVVSLVNLLEPLSPPSLATSACPGANIREVSYVGITAGVDGDNSRQGPARSYLPDGRYPEGCSIGFSVYCLGDPIKDLTGSNSEETWVTGRWLLVAKQPGGWRMKAAHLLSGERSEDQFISDAFVTPETSYARLPLGDPRQCHGSSAYPGKARLKPFNVKENLFTATAVNGVNMGFAVWVPPKQEFTNGNSYLQLFTSGAIPSANPGEASPGGTKSVEWDYRNMLLPELNVPASVRFHGGHVVILAIACLADNIPARTDKAAIADYNLSTGLPVMSGSGLHGFDSNRLARAACQASS
jgi:hypothetical protein